MLCIGRRKIIYVSVFILGVFLILLCVRFKMKNIDGKNVPRYVLTYGENQGVDYPTTKGAYYFAQLVSERTNGEIEVLIYPDAELGDEISVAEQLRFGGVDFTRASISSISDIIPELNILQLPFLYEDSEHMWNVLEGEIGDKYKKLLVNQDMIPLSWYDAGSRSFYTTEKPIRSLEDIRGMKIRVPESELLEELIRALGAEPYPLAFDKVYSALETGQIDGAENNWPSYKSMGHYKVAKYFTLDEHARIPELQLISRFTWEKLPEEYRTIIRQCAEESAVYERKLWKEWELSARETALDAGCSEIHLNPGEREKFEDAVHGIYQKYAQGRMEDVMTIQKLRKEQQSQAGN